MNDVRLCIRQEFCDILIPTLDRKPVAELLGHQRLPIANTDDFASLNSLYLLRVRVCDLATPNDGNPKHVILAHGKPQNSA